MRNGRLHICVVDDDTVYQFIAKRMLENINPAHRFSSFADGQQAIDYLTNNCNCTESIPDIIFLDLNMPIMDGWEFLNQYNNVKHSLCKPTAIYIVSSSVLVVDLQKAKEYTAVSDYLYKPISKVDFDRILELHTASVGQQEL